MIINVQTECQYSNTIHPTPEQWKQKNLNQKIIFLFNEECTIVTEDMQGDIFSSLIQ